MTSDEAINDRAVEKHDERIEAANQVCPRCNGSGIEPCSLCGGHECRLCDGEGVA